MDTWTLQMNYPLVNVHVENGQLVVRQNRFLKNKDATDPGKYPPTNKYNTISYSNLLLLLLLLLLFYLSVSRFVESILHYQIHLKYLCCRCCFKSVLS